MKKTFNDTTSGYDVIERNLSRKSSCSHILDQLLDGVRTFFAASMSGTVLVVLKRVTNIRFMPPTPQTSDKNLIQYKTESVI